MNDPDAPVVQRAPLVARIGGTLVVVLGAWGTQAMARSIFRRSPEGISLYILPVLAITLAPSLILVYLGLRIIRGERMAVYALAAVTVVAAGSVMVMDVRWGAYILGAAVAGLGPLCWAAMRESGGFH